MVKSRKFCVFIILCLISSIFPTPIARAQTGFWWDCHWQHSIRLTFNNSASSENLVNFPVLVNLTSSNMDWISVQSDGDDLRFIDSDNSTELDYEVEYWDYAGEEALIWVEIPQIDSGSTTDHIFMYYGNPEASSGENMEGTWNQDYVMVQHLQEQNGSIYDSTVNDNDGSASPTIFGQDKWVSGLRGNAIDFDGSNDYVKVDDDASLDFGTGDFSVEFIFKTESASAQYFTMKRDPCRIGSGNLPGFLARIEDGDIAFAIDDIAGNGVLKSVVGTWADGEFHHCVIVFDRDDKMYLYIESVLEGQSGSISGVGSVNNANDLYLASANLGNNPVDGIMDDVRVYNRCINSTEINYSFNSGAGADPMNSTGLVGWWKLDESGLTENATDSSGEGNHGTLYGYPPDYTSSGKIDGATDFDGNEDNMNCGDNASLNITDAITLSSWVYLSDTQNIYANIIDRYTGGGAGNGYKLECRGDIFGLAFKDQDNVGHYSTTSSIPYRDAYAFVVGTFDGNAQVLYVNAIEKDRDEWDGTIKETILDLYVGGRHADTYTKSILDECRISNVSRTADWIEAQYFSMTDNFITYSTAADMFLSLFITVENTDSQPIEDACVSLFYETDLNFTQFTDEDGEIPRKIVDEGNYTLLVTADTYQTYSFILRINETTYWVPQLETLEEGITIPLAFMTFMFAGLGVMYYSIKEKTPEQRSLGFSFSIILWIATWGIWIFDNSTNSRVVLGWVFMAPIGLCMLFLTESVINYLSTD